MLYAETSQTASNLGEVFLVHPTSCLGSMEGPAGPIGIQCHGDPVGFYDLAQGCHHRPGGLFFPQLGIQKPVGGVIDYGNHRLVLLCVSGQPPMTAAIQMEHFSKQGPALSSFAVSAAFTSFFDYACFLECFFDKAV